MKTKFIFLLIIWVVVTKAQVTYTINPAKTVSVSAISNSITIFDIYQKNTGASKIVLKWQRVSVNLPAGWQYSMCDYGACYAGIPVGPNTMDTVPVAGQGFLGLNINPLTISGAGSVKVYVYQNGYQSSGDTLTWYVSANLAGIEEITANSGIEIFPNPVKNILSININRSFTENASIYLSDFLGRKIMSTAISSGNNTVDVSGLENGCYYLILETKEKQFYKRIIKSN